jgi:hypothetical protein
MLGTVSPAQLLAEGIDHARLPVQLPLQALVLGDHRRVLGLLSVYLGGELPQFDFETVKLIGR